jgi:hypothetical protein
LGSSGTGLKMTLTSSSAPVFSSSTALATQVPPTVLSSQPKNVKKMRWLLAKSGSSRPVSGMPGMPGRPAMAISPFKPLSGADIIETQDI